MGHVKPQKGNMFSFVTHTWNPIKGKCEHNCSYCYAKQEKELYLDEGAIAADLGEGRHVFVGSGTDLFGRSVPKKYIYDILMHISQYDNQYLFHTKNPARVIPFVNDLPDRCAVGVTIESDLWHGCMANCPHPVDRIRDIALLYRMGIPVMVTVEPILHFSEPRAFAKMLVKTGAFQINIGADSKDSRLDEPLENKVLLLLEELFAYRKEVNIHLKDNLEVRYPGIKEWYANLEGY